MEKFEGYKCSICGKEYLPDQVTYTCPLDGGNLDVVLNYDEINKKFQPGDIRNRSDGSIWRYLPLLPISDPGGEETSLRFVGWTPVYNLIPLAQKNGLDSLWVKDESKNPTASFKDRASAMIVARTRQLSKLGKNIPTLVTASTGNAGAALAGMAAAVGQKAVIFAPKNAPPAKVAQLLVFGAKVLLVDGTYDDAFDLSIQASNAFGWYCRNTGYNPFTLEGKKTAAFEIWEWYSHLIGSPETFSRDKRLTIFVSVGDGNIISGIHKGFKDLLAVGWIENIPRIIGVQAEGSAAIANSFHSGKEQIEAVSANTLADSISVDFPRDGIRAVRAARETGGTYLTVTDRQILEAIADLGRCGIFAEPAGAASYAGLIVAGNKGLLDEDGVNLVVNTGSGLKDVKAAMQSVTEAPVIEPTLDGVRKFL
ncbi:pyridoxal-phosphate dependent enzyme [Chloroflexota bacterium]